MISAAGAVSKTPSPSTRIVTRSGGKVKGAYLRVEISERKYNPNPLSFSHGKHSHSRRGKRMLSPPAQRRVTRLFMLAK
jgi:hypothetical protein